MKLNTLILTASLGLAAAPGAWAGIIFANNPTGFSVPGGVELTFGTPFTVGGIPVTITSLGFFDKDQDGLTGSHTVGIYNQTTTTLLGSVAVQAGTASTLHDGTRWEQLGSPILLSANTTYMLAGTMQATGDQANMATPAEVTLGSGFTLAGTGWTFAIGGTLQYPGGDSDSGVYAFGANMEAGEPDPVPEPGQWAMMAVTALGIAGYAARRVRAKAIVG